MSLKIVTGGTTGAADGTLVSSSNKITFTALDTPVNAHMRCDDDTYSADETFTLPSDGSVQVSFDGGSTWYGSADSPRSVGVDIGDLNVAIKLRQHASTASTSGSFSTDGSFVAASALGDVSGFTVTPGDTQNVLSWSAVANRSSYRVDRATDSGFTTGVVLGVYSGTGTSFTDTGLTNGTTYYYRIKAIGTVRYKDSANYATGNGAPFVSTVTDITSVGSYGRIRNYDGTGTWSGKRSASTGTDVFTGAAAASGAYSDAALALIIRSIIVFNSAALPDGANITDARIRLYGGPVLSGSIGSLVVVGATPTSNTSIAVGDFSKLGSTEFASSRPTLSGWTNGGWNEIVLNAAGRAAISKTGYTAIGFLHSSDFDNSSPASPSSVQWEWPGGSHDPVLRVTYT